MEKSERFGFWLTSGEKFAIARLAEIEGGLSQAALIRRLVREAAQKHGIQVPIDHEETTAHSYVGDYDAFPYE